MLVGEWLMLRAPLQLYKTAFISHNNIKVDLGRGIVRVIKVKRGFTFTDPNGNGRHLADDRILLEDTGFHKFTDRNLERHHAARY